MKQTVNVGAALNDGTGEKLRAGLTKFNQNFDELYNSLFDDQSNASGLGMPAILRGTVSATKAVLANGGAVTAGQTSAVRQATGAALQAALTYAGSAQKFFDCEPGVYEIEKAGGLIIPPSAWGFVWKGSMLNSRISQFSANQPILTIGDITNAQISCFQHIDGFHLEYGIDQAGNTNANALVIAATAHSVIENFNINQRGYSGSTVVRAPYIAILMPSGAGSFSNTYHNFQVQGCQKSMMDVQSEGGGSKWLNAYFTGGALNNALAITGPAVRLGSNGGCNFDVVNIEGVKCQTIVQISDAQEFTWTNGHFETITMTGVNPVLISMGNSKPVFRNLNIDFRCHTSDGASGTAQIFASYGGDRITLENVSIREYWTDNASVNIPVQLHWHGSGGDDNPPSVVATNWGIDDYTGYGAGIYGNIFFDENLPLANFGTPRSVRRYTHGKYLSFLEGAVVDVSANYTHYGASRNATLRVPSALSAAITITLSNKSKASGTGQNVPPVTGDTVRIRRMNNGTYGNTCTIKDGQSGTTLATNAANNTEYLLMFNGTNWVLQ